MRQVLQNLRNGDVTLTDVPCPRLKAGHLLIRTARSLVSAGTERMLLDFGKANYLMKAKQQPEKVAQVLHKVRSEGIMATLNAVNTRLDQPMPMGYCNAGVVIGVGEGVQGYKPGDRVISNGPHAEVVCVPKNLCARIPDEVSDEQACFTVISAIGLQGVRLTAPQLGESVAVFGLGLIGLVAVQLLRAAGTRVIGFDFNPDRVTMAKAFGVTAINLAEGVDPVEAAMTFTDGRGVDAVLVTAATSSHDLMHQAAQMSRKRGRIVLTGVTGLNLKRADFYEKELSFQVSCSYGPGRYDTAYEQGGQDYPIGFVRWTEQRNFEAVLELMRDDRLQVEPLISKRAPLEEAAVAYESLADATAIGIVLTYPEPETVAAERAPLTSETVEIQVAAGADRRSPNVLGIIGAGLFATNKILPHLAKSDCRMKWICSSQGVSGTTAAHKYGIQTSTTDAQQMFQDPEVKAVIITSRHDSHARFVLEALRHGKHVFVEKPMCLNEEELAQVVAAQERGGAKGPLIMVGFNRRFAPLIAPVKAWADRCQSPLSMNFTCNAGAIPADNWTHDPQIGGGRIIGEACHFIDLLQYLAGSPIVQAAALKQTPPGQDLEDNVTLSLSFENGSIGSINYFAGGHKAYPKERLEVFGGGGVMVMDNYRALQGWGIKGFSKKSSRGLRKGHEEGLDAFLQAIGSESESPIPFAELVNSTRATFAVVRAMRERRVIEIETR
ncbi:Bi-domain-containing oxidoreductase [Sulfidibacter corallicola]|uniref:Bi-domain-containing oxidoreductase n=1 Tax=Sulfidibacter corallicola TaxID=2818388 RepID=A0A8A4TXK9_SULCO|nr:bi-domain-containing oxidoreductase [Sulfidibacter corallicola]QTD53844.1 bi-domain-containing oxidoreductase [Sulfidibacter corallicola]